MSDSIRFAGELARVSHTQLVSLDKQTTITIKVPTQMFEEQMSLLTHLMGSAVDVNIQKQ